MGTIRFILYDRVEVRTGKQPINMIYSVEGIRQFFRTSIKLFSANWDSKNQQAIYIDKKEAKKLAPGIEFDLLLSAKEVEEKNNDLATLKTQVREIEKRFELDKVIYSSEMVMSKVRDAKKVNPLTKKVIKSSVILNYIDNWIKDHSATQAASSLSVFRALKAHLSAMAIEKKVNITFEGIDYKFMQAFQNFLIERRGLSNVTVAKQLNVLKRLITFAKKEGFKVSDTYKDIKMSNKDKAVIALTLEEFEALYNLDLSDNKPLDKVRDLFIFSCCTGMRHSDLIALRREHIFKDEIRFTVKKTQEIQTIPLNHYSSSILEKYKKDIKPIPEISGPYYNRTLKGYEKKERSGNVITHKGLCELAGIDTIIEKVEYRGAERIVTRGPKYKFITTHIGRKTFCTLSLALGIPIEVTMAISGHRSFKSFQRYVNVTDKRKKALMTQAWGEIPKNDLKVV